MAEVRAALLDTALAQFGERGFEGVSLRDVAAAVDVTPAALYYHFRTKDSLLVDLVNPYVSALAQTCARLEREREREGGVPPARVLDSVLDVLIESPDLARFVANDLAVQQHAEVGPRIAENNRRLALLLTGSDEPVATMAAQACLGVLLRPFRRQPQEVVAHRDVLVRAAVQALATIRADGGPVSPPQPLTAPLVRPPT